MTTTPTAEDPQAEMLAVLTAQLEEKDQQIAEQLEVIAKLNAEIATLEAKEDALGKQILATLDSVQDKLTILKHKGRKVRVLSKTISALGKIVVFSMKLKKALAERNKNVEYVAWEELSDSEKDHLFATADSIFEDEEGEKKNVKS
jgi:tRNA/tmRNA/rRNA uracil-C5-methylase (TrmA/RlmC/RlmD family)